MKLRGLIAILFALSCAPALAQTQQGTSPLTGAKGGTNNAFMQFAGPATSLKTFTLPNASGTVGVLNAIETWTAVQTFNDSTVVLLGSSTTTNVAAPATPASGLERFWSDLTDKRFHDKNDAGTIGTTVVSSTLAAHNFATNISTAGVLGGAQPVVADISGFGTGVATALGVNVGTAGSPVINGGVLGTPSSGTATNLTGLPISSGLTGAGTGILTALGVNVGSAGAPVINGGALGSPSSAGTMPAFTLGGTVTGGGNNISNATYNGLTITSTAGTLTIPNSASAVLSLSGNFGLTLTATGATNSTFPSGTHTLAAIDQAPILQGTLTASNSASLSFTGFSATYNDYLITFDNLVPVTNAQAFNLQIHSGGSFQSSTYLNGAGGATAAISLTPAAAVDNTAGIGFSGRLYIHNVNSTSVNKFVMGPVAYKDAGSVVNSSPAGYWNGGQGAVDGFQVLFASGNISTGTVKIYGIP